MVRVRSIEDCEPLTHIDGNGHGITAAFPGADAKFFVCQALSLQGFVGGPLETSVGVAAEALLEVEY